MRREGEITPFCFFFYLQLVVSLDYLISVEHGWRHSWASENGAQSSGLIIFFNTPFASGVVLIFSFPR